MLIGASIAAGDIDVYEPLFSGNDIMRIFPVDVAIGGVKRKVLPNWSDKRLDYCRRTRTIPFLSCKIDGHSGGLDHVREQLRQMPAWIIDDPAMRVYITDRHEPEGDLDGGPAAYRRNFAKFLAMIDSLPALIRHNISCGPVLTKTWTENNGEDKGHFKYETYDPGTGDFLGIDCYVPAGTREHVMSPARLPAPAEFLKHVKAYQFSPADTRPRIFPELGLIGMPADHDGSARAAWIKGVHDEVAGWRRPWDFLGWIWWNQKGNNTGDVELIGGRRDFALDMRTVDAHTVVKLNPPKPLQTFNAIWKAQHRPATPARPHDAQPVAAATGV
ncbi:hypothetical protein Acy02nite_48000 [Actinoplanes cyaneus]|uniref:GH26 domain-containing protein n=1 Tax=Actinoplanes cyaneus TaxID=52696 RepID=A0A919M8X1_9ACTN|nr:hypothetical protein [Actinoplanes cyaneus]MCW2138756.1 hypothetical protein [Actinoplanes cyaneus]GID66919.1 hypothetical protein Acy02nite_48000 [Actinoplanes cyaneus]